MKINSSRKKKIHQHAIESPDPNSVLDSDSGAGNKNRPNVLLTPNAYRSLSNTSGEDAEAQTATSVLEAGGTKPGVLGVALTGRARTRWPATWRRTNLE